MFCQIILHLYKATVSNIKVWSIKRQVEIIVEKYHRDRAWGSHKIPLSPGRLGTKSSGD
jgi:hypothetical protein